MLVEARVEARLLGLRVLAVDANVLLLPARLVARAKETIASSTRLELRERRPGRRAPVKSHRLSEATRMLDESGTLLMHARENRIPEKV
jgi:hypothetical protein